jgi:hypothetical protein
LIKPKGVGDMAATFAVSFGTSSLEKFTSKVVSFWREMIEDMTKSTDNEIGPIKSSSKSLEQLPKFSSDE